MPIDRTPPDWICISGTPRSSGFRSSVRIAADGTVRICNRGPGVLSVSLFLMGIVLLGIGLYAHLTRPPGERSLLPAMGGMALIEWLCAFVVYLFYEAVEINPTNSTARWLARRGPFRTTATCRPSDIRLHTGVLVHIPGGKPSAHGLFLIFEPAGRVMLAAAVTNESKLQGYLDTLPPAIQELASPQKIEYITRK